MNKKILILGGTQMIGRDFVETIQNNNDYSITIANRGITNNTIFSNIEKIKIDRNSQEKCESLSNRYFDIVIDFSCYDTHYLTNVLKYIKYNQYFILSSLCSNDTSVLNDTTHWLYHYCHGKNRLENYILNNNLSNFTIIRPCVIYGKNDYTNRFYEKDNICYWRHDNTVVERSVYYIPVSEFTEQLSYLITNNLNLINKQNIIHINGDGIQIMNSIPQYTIHPYESNNINIQKFTSPFNYVIIDNLLRDDIYQKLCEKFPSFIARTKPYKDQPGATSNYEGYISGLGINDLIDGYDFFASKELQSFIENIFNIKTSKYISPSAHFHRAPSKDGFVHRDTNICSFRTGGEDEDFITTGGVIYTDDTINNPNSIKQMRSIALLYYLNNKQSDDCIGGGTGIYKNVQKELITEIKPINNRLFMFEIGPNTFHSFVGANFDRSAIVSWFHSSPAYIINRYWKYYRKNQGYIEKWGGTPTEKLWPIENDPEYSKYFNRPLKELL